jgi:zinc protease
VDRTVHKGIEPKSIVGVFFPGEHEYSRGNNYQLRALATALEIKLREEVREQASGSYFVSVNTSVSQYPDEEYRLDVLFACDPDRVEELTELVFESVRSVQESGLEPVYATKVKEIQTRTHEEELETNRYWLDTLQTYYLNGFDPSHIIDYPDLVARLDAEALREAARNYIDLNHYVRVVLRPEAQEQE